METPITTFAQPPDQLVQGKGFGIRAGAYVIDVIVIWIVALGVGLTVGLIIGILSGFVDLGINFNGDTSTGLNLLLGFISSTFYFALFEWLYGSTPGKLILGMRVVMDDGSPCTFVAAIIRAVLRNIDGLFFGIPAYVNMKEPLLQRIGDKAAKTLVVDAKSTFVKSPRPWWWLLISFALFGLEEVVASVIGVFSLA